MATVQYCNYDIKGTLAVTGTSTFTGAATFSSSINMSDNQPINFGGQTMFTHTGSITRIGDNSSSSVLSISGGNATFTGNIYASSSSSTIGTPRIIMQSDGTLDWGQAYDSGTLTWNTGYALMYGQSGKGIKFATNGSTTALTLDTSQNATFAENVTVDGKLKVANRWDNSTLANNAIYAQNTTDGFAFGVGTDISTWFAWDSTQGQNDMISISNDGSKVTIHENLYLGNVDTSSNGTSALVLNSSGTNEVEKRTLGTGAFGPTPVGAYLPLAGGTMTGNIQMSANTINFDQSGSSFLGIYFLVVET